ncbi:hypothetical protein [Anaeromyxobacter sp. PSR-1]|uniref:hypothetical protein n=1 Tax=Anaeromyxobacter sp. PSR-1 TaxID=1300915 RepID=UPI0007518732|nr:hypothetical protein [Anaeromyxobacter sp. PSR-1]
MSVSMVPAGALRGSYACDWIGGNAFDPGRADFVPPAPQRVKDLGPCGSRGIEAGRTLSAGLDDGVVGCPPRADLMRLRSSSVVVTGFALRVSSAGEVIA